MKIIFQNSNFIVLDKPYGVSTHNESPSVLDFLKKNQLPDHFVNRLDTETSGLLLVAKQKNLHEPLRLSLDQGQKKYIALLRGSISLNPGEIMNWAWPISDKAEGRKNPQGLKKDQKNAETQIGLIQKNKYLSLVEVILKTGRQHQIRKHSALADHAIVGDKRYNDEKYNQIIFDKYQIKRMFLHAAELSFEFDREAFNFKSEVLEWEKLLINS